MMRPKPLARIAGSASRVVWKAELRLIARIWSHLVVGNSVIGATCWMPALFTRMSSRPCRASSAAIIAEIAAGSDMSALEQLVGTANSRAMPCSVAATSSGGPKPFSTMVAPAAARLRAMPRPIPLVEPVTSATRPAKSRAAAGRVRVWMFMAMLRGCGPQRAVGFEGHAGGARRVTEAADGAGEARPPGAAAGLHMRVVHHLDRHDVGGGEHHRQVAGVLPPMRMAGAEFRGPVAGAV